AGRRDEVGREDDAAARLDRQAALDPGRPQRAQVHVLRRAVDLEARARLEAGDGGRAAWAEREGADAGADHHAIEEDLPGARLAVVLRLDLEKVLEAQRAILAAVGTDDGRDELDVLRVERFLDERERVPRERERARDDRGPTVRVGDSQRRDAEAPEGPAGDLADDHLAVDDL